MKTQYKFQAKIEAGAKTTNKRSPQKGKIVSHVTLTSGLLNATIKINYIFRMVLFVIAGSTNCNLPLATINGRRALDVRQIIKYSANSTAFQSTISNNTKEVWLDFIIQVKWFKLYWLQVQSPGPNCSLKEWRNPRYSTSIETEGAAMTTVHSTTLRWSSMTRTALHSPPSACTNLVSQDAI